MYLNNINARVALIVFPSNATIMPSNFPNNEPDNNVRGVPGKPKGVKTVFATIKITEAKRGRSFESTLSPENKEIISELYTNSVEDIDRIKRNNNIFLALLFFINKHYQYRCNYFNRNN